VSAVEPEEMEALVGERTAEAPRVLERDFAQPLRLGATRAHALEKKLVHGIQRVEARLSEELGRPYVASLAGLREVHAEAASAGLTEPLAAVRFSVAGQPGWAVWNCEAAVRAVETLLCGAPGKNLARALSELEATIVLAATEGAVREVANFAELAVDGFRVVTTLPAFGSWQEAGELADPHRLAVDLKLRLGELVTELAIYLPGMTPEAEAPQAPAELPEHLDLVEVTLSAQLGEVEVPLAELLKLEHGDVISLGAPEGGTLAIMADEVQLARALLGTHEGRLAVRLTEVAAPEALPAARQGKRHG
jgi:flagellar motor switch protein FliM